MVSDEQILRDLLDAALKAASPFGKFDPVLPAPPRGRTIVVGAGKASALMAAAFEAVWPYPIEGLVVTRYGHGAPTRAIQVVEAAHPVPDEAGQQAARQILSLARSAGAEDLVIALISGGASALLSLPAEGITLEDKQYLSRALLASGAPIGEMNVVRKALSAIKGGRLAAATSPAQLVTYLISDVPGDDPATIGSGPTIPEAADPHHAPAILRRYGIEIGPDLLAAMARNQVSEPAPGGAVHMLATPLMALQAAAGAAREHGLSPIILGDALEGEAREVGRALAGVARSVSEHSLPVSKPAVLLSGGETTVTLKGKGRGGRNTELLLSLLIALGGRTGISALAADTDGIDGVEANAGAWFDAETLARARQLGLSAYDRLADNDAFSFFELLGKLVVTGPTLTNVNDFRAILVR